MRASYFLSFAIAFSGSDLLMAAPDEDAARIANAGAAFKKNCMHCHQAPDLRFTSDRAWLGQIRETA